MESRRAGDVDAQTQDLAQPGAEELDTQNLPGMPIDSDDRRQAFAGEPQVIGVAELEPQPPVPHRLTASNVAAARRMCPHRPCAVTARLLSRHQRGVAPPQKVAPTTPDTRTDKLRVAGSKVT
jgi:hypothetical protein